MQRPRQPQTNAPPAMARYRRTRTVERKIDLIRKPSKLAGPERQLARYRALAIILRAQNRMLPQRVIGILNRQRRHRGRLPTAARLVKAPEIAQQRRQRPAVAGNVMQQQKNNVLALPQRKHMHTQRRLARKIKARTRRRRQRSSKRGFAHRRYRKPRPRRIRIQDLLPRNPERVGEDRAQALVTPNQVANRRLQRNPVQRPPHPQRQRDRVGRARTFQTVQEPQPALRIRQRDLRRTRQRTQRRTRSLRIPQPLHQRLNRRSLEQAADRKLNIQRRADAADQTRRQQRMTPEREEVVVDPHTLQPKHLRKQARTGSPPAACAVPAAPLPPAAPAPAAHDGQACRWASAEAAPAPQTQKAPCAREGSDPDAHATPQHPEPQHPPQQHSQPDACPRGRPRAQSPQPAQQPHAQPAPPRSPQARSGSPRTFTCASARPRNSSTPSPRQRARSPVRYIRLPAAPNGSATNRSAVSPARPTYPRARPEPAM